MLRPAQKLIRFHWFSMFLMLALAVAGLFFIYSASHTASGPIAQAAKQQSMWLGAGLFAFFAMSLLDYRILIDYGLWIFGAAVLLIIMVIAGGTMVYGQQNWLHLGSFSLQPSEFAKIAFICGFTWLLMTFIDRIKKFSVLLLLIAFSMIPFGLIVLQGDSGSAVIFAPITYFMLLVAGVKKRYLLVPLFVAVAGYAFCYFVIYKGNWDGTFPPSPAPGASAVQAGKKEPDDKKSFLPASLPFFSDKTKTVSDKKSVTLIKPHQLGRIKTFFNPSLDPKDSGYAVTQSLTAIGSGGLTGKGYLKGDQTVYGFIPATAAHNDYIFTTIADEFGFIGGTSAILAQSLLLFAILTIAHRAKDVSGALLVTGVFGMFLTHFFINTGMTYNVVPVIGIPQPFLSYGGTFLVTCMAAMGIVQSVWIHRKDY